MEYFGLDDSSPDGQQCGYGGYTVYNSGQVWTCPGSGDYDVNELGVYMAGLTSGNYVRMAIYTTAGDFVMQWAAAIEGDGTTKWITGTSFTDQAGDPIASPQLSGGTNYRLACSFSGNGCWQLNNGSAGDMYYVGGDYSASGFPSSLTGGGSSGSHEACFRCGVTAAAGGETVEATAPDGVSMSDAAARTATYPVAAADGASMSDAAAPARSVPGTAADGMTGADATAAVGAYLATAADGATMTDASSVLAALLAVAADATKLADAVTTAGFVDAEAADGIAASDAASALAALYAVAVESVTVSDTGAVTATLVAEARDGVTASDVSAAVAALLGLAADALKMTDYSTEDSTLPSGLVTMTVTSKAPSVTVTVKVPTITATAQG